MGDTSPLLKKNREGQINASQDSLPLPDEPDAQHQTSVDGCCGDWYPKLVLTFIMFITFGSYWVFDTPGALYDNLKDWFGDGYSHSKNLALYSVYSYPNIVLCLFGGHIIDNITGIRLGAIMFCGFILAGELIFCIGVQFKNYYLALAGRFIFGLGGESLTVAQTTFTARWFDGPQLALAFGIVLSFSRIGSSVNFALTPTLANSSVPLAIWIGGATCVFSFVACLMLCGLDWYGETKLQRVREIKSSDGVFSFDQLKAFPLETWLIYGICVFFYIGILTFYTVASSIMQDTGPEYSESTASLFVSIPNFVSIFASPAFGFVVDKYGRSLYWIAASCVGLAIAHLAFLGNANDWWFIHPIPVMIWLGFSYALCAAALWPLLPFILPPEQLGTGYGAMTAVQNAGLAVFPQAIGILQDTNGINGTDWEYTLPLMIFVGCAVIAFLFTLWLIAVDRRGTGILNASGEAKNRWRDSGGTSAVSDPVPPELREEEQGLIQFIEEKPDISTYLRKDDIFHRTAYLTQLGIHKPKELL